MLPGALQGHVHVSKIAEVYPYISSLQQRSLGKFAVPLHGIVIARLIPDALTRRGHLPGVTERCFPRRGLYGLR